MVPDFMDMVDTVALAVMVTVAMGLAVMDMATLITTHLIMLIHEL